MRQSLLPEPCQEIRPVGRIMNNRLLVVAASGAVREGASDIPHDSASPERELRGREAQDQGVILSHPLW